MEAATDPNALRKFPRQRRSRERVEQILNAAAEVFTEVGYDVATTHLIAARAGAAVGSLYQFFPDKQAIFRALADRHMIQLQAFYAELSIPEMSELSLEDLVKRIVHLTMRFLSAPAPRLMFILYYTSPQLFADHKQNFLPQLLHWAENLLSIRNPTLSTDKAKLVAKVFIQTANHLMLLALQEEGERQQHFYAEIEVILIAYLRPYNSYCLQNSDIALPSGAEKLSKRQKKTLRLVMEYSEITLQQLESLYPNQSRRTLQRDLKTLVTLGWLISTGETNQRTYLLQRPEN